MPNASAAWRDFSCGSVRNHYGIWRLDEWQPVSDEVAEILAATPGFEVLPSEPPPAEAPITPTDPPAPKEETGVILNLPAVPEPEADPVPEVHEENLIHG